VRVGPPCLRWPIRADCTHSRVNGIARPSRGNFTGGCEANYQHRGEAFAMCADADGPAGTPGTLTLRLGHLRAGVPVVHASGRLDGMTAPGLQHLLDDQLATEPWAIVVDLNALSVLKSEAVPTLVHVAPAPAKPTSACVSLPSTTP